MSNTSDDVVTTAYDRLEATIQLYVDQIHEINNRLRYNHAHLETIYLGLCAIRLIALTRANHHTTQEEQVLTTNRIRGAHQITLLLGVKIERVKREVYPLCDDLESVLDRESLPPYST